MGRVCLPCRPGPVVYSSRGLNPVHSLTVQLSRFQRDSPDNEAHVPSPASPMVGTIDVPTSALYRQLWTLYETAPDQIFLRDDLYLLALGLRLDRE